MSESKQRAVSAPHGKAIAPGGALEEMPDEVDVDDIDLSLLSLLANDSRASQRQLGRAVEMSPSAVGERLARLERLGVIKQYTVSLDWARLGYPVVVHMPVVAVTGTDIGEIVQALTALPEVEYVSVVSGAYDLLAQLRVRDHRHLSELLLERIWPIPTVQRTETLLCLAATKQRPLTVKLLEQLRAQT
ncbi:Lrp/AsnC family transcriptional regulator [Paenarthrobacter sp. AB444]|uniref:Lrp/AsnC family transcriptional regulator n=1 Tax=Paenarthrobacter sp. AB444 TaxID=3025681 RepID=UPI002365FFA0|nr:Lrp/AsnC family transcriptional regulator [Paenarthrobacter sp. AB444]MDD7833888.1 Lrp/AsnC family transcriptional regulator [Paenarthrobacter sp. AB444]